MKKNQIYEIVAITMLIASVVVLQFVSTFITIGPIPITLTLIPIVIGAILFNIKGGIIVGSAFGIIVTIFGITAIDINANFWWNANPVAMVIVCVLKGAAAGFTSAVVFNALKKINFKIAIIIAACVAPIANTLVFVVGVYTLFYQTLLDISGGSRTLIFVLTTLIGINFLVEFLINTILSPAIIRIIKIERKEE